MLLVIASANRDPERFVNPESINIDRSETASLVFGNGIHHCVGHLLAKMEIPEFLTALLQRFLDLDLCDEQLEWSSALSFRGLDHLHVRWAGNPRQEVS